MSGSRRSGGGSDCTLNGAIVGFDGNATLRVGVQPYQREDQLRDLRRDHRTSQVFRREKEDISSVSLVGGTEPLGERTEDRKLKDSTGLAAVLVLDALLRYFHDHGRPIWRHKPLRVVSNKGADQLLRSATPHGAHVPGWLEQRVSYVFDTRVVYPDQAPPNVLLVCDVKTCNFIAASCAQLLEHGVPIEGRYVQVAGVDGDPRLSPNRDSSAGSSTSGKTSSYLTTMSMATRPFEQ